MKIFITPEEILKRCLWDNYTTWILRGDMELAKCKLVENLEFEISEEDALVMGILKILETPNIIHKFNSYITDNLLNRSIVNGGESYIRKKTLTNLFQNFNKNFPDYWQPNLFWSKCHSEYSDYSEWLLTEIEKLEVKEIKDKFGSAEYVSSKAVKKLLKFNYM